MTVDRGVLLTVAALLLGCGGGTGPTPPPPPPPPAPVATVTVSLGQPNLGLQQTTQATATLRSATNQVLTGRTVTWSSSAPTVASVGFSGLVTGLVPGAADITATAEGISGSAPVQVHHTEPNYTVANVVLTQVVQPYAGGVPLVVGGNPVLVNVFGTLDRPYGTAVPTPVVKIEIFSGATPVLTDEKPMNRSASAILSHDAPLHQVVLPASIVQPGLRVRVTLNAAGAPPEETLTDNVWPADGLPDPIPVQQVPPLPMHFVPILLSTGGSTGTVTAGTLPEYLTATRQMHPVSSIMADIGPTFSTDVDFGGGLAPAWIAILQQLDLVRVMEGATGYYVGALRPPPGVTFVQFGGWGYIPGNPASTGPGTRTNVLVGVGWFNRFRQTTELVAHELSHNMGRLHAPCGGAAGPDQNFPYPNGSIGTYGHDLYQWSLTGTGVPQQYNPGTGDVMSYCPPPWISDYTYLGLLAARGGAAGAPAAVSASGSCPCLVAWGSVEAGVIELEPSFIAPPPARPSAAAPGPYTLRILDRSGRAVASRSFEASVIDHAPDVRHFAALVPLAEASRVSRLEVRGPERGTEQVVTAALRAPGEGIRTARIAPNALEIRWDRNETPFLIVRDPATGRVLGFGRSGRLAVSTGGAEVELIGPGWPVPVSLRAP